MVLVMPLPPKLDDFPKPVDISSQVGALDEGDLDDPTLEEAPVTYSPTTETLGPSSNVPPSDVALSSAKRPIRPWETGWHSNPLLMPTNGN